MMRRAAYEPFSGRSLSTILESVGESSIYLTDIQPLGAFIMRKSIASILDSEPLKKHRHVCGIFRSREEAKQVMGEFIAEGCFRGHKTIFLLDPDMAADARQHLSEQGVDVDTASVSGKFELQVWKDNYLKGGETFSCDSILDFIDESMSAAHDGGHECIWAAGDMNWAGKDPENSAELIAYEARLNELKPKFEDDVWICFYDASLFSGTVISEVIRAHPVVLMGRSIFENSLYTPPDELLKELAEYETFKQLPRLS
ncbi:MAG TPA: MEDS domain-containing protein [Trichormus sp.]|jgi:hypothetical protein